jgi:hypothetical protein
MNTNDSCLANDVRVSIALRPWLPIIVAGVGTRVCPVRSWTTIDVLYPLLLYFTAVSIGDRRRAPG